MAIELEVDDKVFYADQHFYKIMRGTVVRKRYCWGGGRLNYVSIKPDDSEHTANVSPSRILGHVIELTE